MLTELTQLMKEMLDRTSVNQAHLVTRRNLQVCNVDQVQLVNTKKSFMS